MATLTGKASEANGTKDGLNLGNMVFGYRSVKYVCFFKAQIFSQAKLFFREKEIFFARFRLLMGILIPAYIEARSLSFSV